MSKTLSGIEPGTFRLVAQCINPLCHTLCVQHISDVISRLGVMLQSVYMWKENTVLDVLTTFKL